MAIRSLLKTRQPSSAHRDVKIIALVLAGALTFLALLLALAVQTGLEPWKLFADATSVANANPLSSAVSSLSIMSWTAAAALTLLAGAVARANHARTESRFLLFFGAWSLLLAVDDQFLLHEWYIPMLPFGGQSVYVVGYGMVFIGFVVTQWAMLQRHSPLLFSAAVIFLAGSVCFDTAADAFGLKPVWAGPTEDSLKFIGVALWLGYAVVVSWRSLRQGNQPVNDLNSVNHHIG